MRRLQAVHRAQRMQVRQRRHIAQGMVRALGQEVTHKAKPQAGASMFFVSDHEIGSMVKDRMI
jgi:hypothetical protein